MSRQDMTNRRWLARDPLLELEDLYVEQNDSVSAWYIEGYRNGRDGFKNFPPSTFGELEVQAYKQGFEDGDGERSDRS